jgi:hypothetical protein
MNFSDLQIYPIERLREFSTRIFLYFGVPASEAALAARRGIPLVPAVITDLRDISMKTGIPFE